MAGGIRISEPAADLGLALAIASSLTGFPAIPGLAVTGEIGLSGELRSVSHLDRRLNEIKRLGFSSCLLPTASVNKIALTDRIELLHARTVREAMAIFLKSIANEMEDH